MSAAVTPAESQISVFGADFVLLPMAKMFLFHRLLHFPFIFIMYKNITLLFIFAFLVLSGCGNQTTKVSGTVTLDGKGLKDIVVLLQPVTDTVLSNEAAFGKTNEEGQFSLSLMNSKKSGVLPGEYAVFINWNDPNPPPENQPPNPCPYKIPSSAKDGSFRYVVKTQGTQHIDFNLSEFSHTEKKPQN
jgi:hypothetical protein